ncbi:hypothetical protein AAFF_G00297520 [Aldrovandia affinis]|uniref:Uncharacterized protein n=1 Tax=Aldrovandia affinis TaxID=143900 RepID=A0AAD7SS73_9TELE|nr:hypothetical protein AAFF_G00297520 [Aldrovandia affinis]
MPCHGSHAQRLAGSHVHSLPSRQPTLHMDERRVMLLPFLDLGGGEGKATNPPHRQSSGWPPSGANRGADLLQLLVPRALRTQVLQLVHGATGAGHFGNNKTICCLRGAVLLDF